MLRKVNSPHQLAYYQIKEHYLQLAELGTDHQQTPDLHIVIETIQSLMVISYTRMNISPLHYTILIRNPQEPSRLGFYYMMLLNGTTIMQFLMATVVVSQQVAIPDSTAG